jgi:hypothetical protein
VVEALVRKDEKEEELGRNYRHTENTVRQQQSDY